MTKPNETTAPAALTAQQLDQHKRELAIYLTGVTSSERQSDAYRAVVGLKCLEIKPLLPHGNENHEAGFQEWIERSFPQVEYRTCARYMEYARELLEDAKRLSPAQRRPLLLTEPSKHRVEELAPLLDKVHRGLSFSEYLKSKRTKRNKRKRLTPEEKAEAQIDEAKQFFGEGLSALRLMVDDLKSKGGILAGNIQPAQWKELRGLYVELNKLTAELCRAKAAKVAK